MPHGHDLWMKKYNDSTEAARDAREKEVTARDAKTARLRAARLADEAASPVVEKAGRAKAAGKRRDEGKRPDELNAANDE
jgi:hypothetical protein